jgi:hypothetical protein
MNARPAANDHARVRVFIKGLDLVDGETAIAISARLVPASK